ncbi:MAG: DUF3153 domain-containing protein [Prochlorothrix sp.]
MVQKIAQGMRVLLILVLASGLGGCIQYDLGLRFDHQTAGAIVQSIALNPAVSQFSPNLIQDWFTALDRQAPHIPSLGQQVAPDRYVLTVPFYGSQDLVQKFAQVIPLQPAIDPASIALTPAPIDPAQIALTPASIDPNPIDPTPAPIYQPQTWQGALPPIAASLSLEQDNRLIAIHNHLTLTLDLRPLTALDRQGRSLLGQTHLLQVAFSLQTPWGLDWATTDPPLAPQHHSNQVVWSLPVGEVTTIETAFWVPSPIGMGTIVILGLMLLGLALRRLRSAPLSPPQSPPNR